MKNYFPEQGRESPHDKHFNFDSSAYCISVTTQVVLHQIFKSKEAISWKK